jgi:hypothetical protein
MKIGDLIISTISLGKNAAGILKEVKFRFSTLYKKKVYC